MAVPRPAGRGCYHEFVGALLDIRNLTIEFPTQNGTARAAVSKSASSVAAVCDLSFSIGDGEVLGLVGESGSGKSITSLAIMRLLPPQARVSGEILFAENGTAPRNLPKLTDGAEVGITDRQFQIQCLQLLLKLYPSR